MARKRPMTTEELFNRINGILKEKGKLPDILDYGLATHSPVPVYYDKNVPLFRRNGYRKSGAMIPKVRNKDNTLNGLLLGAVALSN